MNRAVALALILAALTAPAAAQTPAADADPMAAFYGAPLTIDVPPDWNATRRYARDHTYRDEGADGTATGTWTLEGDRVCVVQVSPPGRRFCNLGPGHRRGDAWTDHDPYTGNLVLFRLEPEA